jgi:nucleotide-binding universal stress UspA family protein
MKMLLAYDGSDHSRVALEEAIRVAREAVTRVTILAVVTEAEAPSRFATGPRPHAQDDVVAAHARFAEVGIDAKMKVAEGDPATEILREASEGDYDLVVTGSRGRGPVRRLVLGSVSHEVAELAPCTVLVVSDDHTLRIEPKAGAVARVG